MGGRCYIWMPKSDGTLTRILGPICTDNFQIVSPRFTYSGLEWHSVEQAFQALKFPLESIAHNEIYATGPIRGESDKEYGLRVWALGQPRYDSTIRDDWDQVKVKVMLLLNLAKYASDSSFQTALIDTGNQRIEAQPSTTDWQYWNTCTQTLIRKLLHSQADLHSVIGDVEDMPPHEVEIMLADSHENL